MVKIKTFKGVRPPKELAAYVSCRPYDVLSSEEARRESLVAEEQMHGQAQSLYRVIRPEINFEEGTDEHDERVYDEAANRYALFLQKGWLKQDEREGYYVYAQTWRGKTQYGLMVAASVEDYEAERIRKHELTLRAKEDDRMRHVMACQANLGSAFFAYPPHAELKAIIARVAEAAPEYDFVADEVRHRMWPIYDSDITCRITEIFASFPQLYIADGHHRSAAAARVGKAYREANPRHTGEENYNYFLTTCFSADELTILDYNRLILDLGGMKAEEVIRRLEQSFHVETMGKAPYTPARKHEAAVYMDGCWYRIYPLDGTFSEDDPIASLDVSITSELILSALFGIEDLRTDHRISFVGGIRGLRYLQDQVDQGAAQMALALYPVSMEEIMRVADAERIMPPKATWFEPKLRTGIVVHSLKQ